MGKKTLVVLDDTIDLTDFMAGLAEMVGFETQKFYSSQKFIDEYENSPDVIILDLMIPDVDGIEVMRYLVEQKSTSQLILVSGIDKTILNVAEEFAKASKLNLLGSLTKPFRSHELRSILQKAKGV